MLSLKDSVQNVINNKLVQFDNAATPNIITNPLPSYLEGNMNAIITVEEKGSEFLLTIIPMEGYASSLGPRKPP